MTKRDPAYQIAVLGEPVDRPSYLLESWERWDPATHPVLLVNLPLDAQDDVLQTIRKDSARYLQPIFCVNQSPYANALADGGEEQLDERAASIIERLAILTPHEHPGDVEKLAWYIWARHHFRLLPLWQSRFHQGYRYPLLDCLFGEDASDSLPQLVAEHVLSSDILVDRLRLCNNCGSAHLNFVDVCPECSHIAIQVKPAVHCFTCGHVDDQDAFMNQGRLRCPKCMTTLRHIGVDYDRPLEKYRCISCHARFVEADVRARCHECSRVHKPDDLIVSPIYQYRAGTMARHVARDGAYLPHRPMRWRAPIPMEHFTWLLQWGNSLLQRHGLQSTLLAVRIDNLGELQEAWGVLQTRQRLDGLLVRLQAMLRDTDVMSQYADDVLLVLLPKAGKDHWKVFETRIRQLNAVEGLDNLSLTLTAQLLPARIGDDPGVWLSRWLDGEKGDA
jgi:hypothetical protein